MRFGLIGAVLLTLVEPALADPAAPLYRPADLTLFSAQTEQAASFATEPKLRPDNLGQVTQLFKNRKIARLYGGKICGSKHIRGEKIGNISNGACGIKNPVKVRAVRGIPLSTPATINCDTAKALDRWVDKTAIPTFKRKGKLAELKVVASYSCRTRNNKKGAKLSEHAKGNAIDIAGVTLENGKVLTVLGDWNGKNSKEMRKLHKGACGPFGTVLGPKADRYHQDHFHFDVASYRSGRYCR